MNREGTIQVQTIVQKAMKRIRDDLNNNRELFLAQVIAMNPDINLLEYSLCHMSCYAEQDESGITKHYDKWWLEKIV